MGLLLLTNEARAKTWKRVFDDAGEEIILSEAAVSNPAAVSCLACWVPPADLSVYPNLKALLSTGAGVDHSRVEPFHGSPPGTAKAARWR